MKKVVITAGGTGGHVYPGLAIAKQLMVQGYDVEWLGTAAGLEARVVPQAGIPITYLGVKRFRRSGRLNQLLSPFALLGAIFQALFYLLKTRPALVVGMGGFVAGPAGIAAWLLRKPLLIHEQNAVAGFTNVCLAKIATRVLSAFPDALPAKYSPQVVGNPVRGPIVDLPSPEQRGTGQHQPRRLLILGGSLGAKAVNELVLALWQSGKLTNPIEIYHQAGPKQEASMRTAYAAAGIKARVVGFIEDMPEAYAWADLVICRSGALSVAEIAAAGVASLLIPFPYAVDDHQRINAEYLANQGAAILCVQKDLTVEYLAATINPLLEGDALATMADKARALAKPDAIQVIVGCCEELLL